MISTSRGDVIHPAICAAPTLVLDSRTFKGAAASDKSEHMKPFGSPMKPFGRSLSLPFRRGHRSARSLARAATGGSIQAMQHAASTIEHAASTKVQNLYRGKLARKALALERSAATRVQAMYRGQLARGAMVLQGSRPTKVVGAHGHWVDAPTPEADWFTPEHGWPAHLLQPPTLPASIPTLAVKQRYEPPTNWMQSHVDESVHSTHVAAAIGELRIELLEAERLPQMDKLIGGLTGGKPFGSADPYAVVVFEGSAARTSTVRNSREPKWSAAHGCARAFRFPVCSAYSCVHISLMDYDLVGDDEVIGRCVVELGSLYARTQYDCWLPLAKKGLRHPGRRGAVRLRYSVVFDSDRQRLLSYVRPLQNPTYHVPLLKQEYSSATAFARLGARPEDKYDYHIFKAHIYELRAVAIECRNAVLRFVFELLFYEDLRSSAISIGVCDSPSPSPFTRTLSLSLTLALTLTLTLTPTLALALTLTLTPHPHPHLTLTLTLTSPLPSPSPSPLTSHPHPHPSTLPR